MIKTKGTKEWSDCSFNLFQGGCVHNCTYCYARRLEQRFNRTEFKIKENLKYPTNKKVMFPTTHDIDLKYEDLFSQAIIELLKRNNEILLVTKASYEDLSPILDTVCQKGYKDQMGKIEIRPTITTPNSETIRKYEKQTADYTDRLSCLQVARYYGCPSSVSIEPLLCTPDELDTIIWDITSEFDVFSIWIGALSYVPPEMKPFVDSIYTSDNFDLIYNEQKKLKIVQFKDTFMNRYNAMKEVGGKKYGFRNTVRDRSVYMEKRN